GRKHERARAGVTRDRPARRPGNRRADDDEAFLHDDQRHAGELLRLDGRSGRHSELREAVDEVGEGHAFLYAAGTVDGFCRRYSVTTYSNEPQATRPKIASYSARKAR